MTSIKGNLTKNAEGSDTSMGLSGIPIVFNLPKEEEQGSSKMEPNLKHNQNLKIIFHKKYI